MYQLFGRAGWGSVLVESQLVWYGLPYWFEEMDDLFTSAEARDKLATVNPLSQVPTLVLPDGQIMTESVAITLHLADVTGADSLVPAVGDAGRPKFLRWLVFMVANLYPTFTYADDPARFVAGDESQAVFRRNVDAYAIKLWRMVEGEIAGPCFLGDRFSAMDIYIAVMSRWRPRRDWFAAHLPRVADLAQTVDANPKLSPVWTRNFPVLLPPEEAP